MSKPMHRRYLSAADCRDYPMALAAVKAAEAGPTTVNLDTAPVLNEWWPASCNVTIPVLFGRVQNHPKLGDTLVRTSRLIALHEKAHWARTFSRWYRLRSPAMSPPKGDALPFGTTLFTSRLGLDALMDEYIKRVRELEPASRGYQ